MKNVIIILALILSSTSAYAGGITNAVYVDSFETRSTGYHSVWMSEAPPSEATAGCHFKDRAVVDENDAGAKTMISTLLAALASNKKVVLYLSGCVQINDSAAFNAAKIVKVQLYRN